MTIGWTCSKCTYEHHAPSQRCVMCNELRVSRQQMRDFVQGIPIPTTNTTVMEEQSSKNRTAKEAPQRTRQTTTSIQPGTPSSKTTPVPTVYSVNNNLKTNAVSETCKISNATTRTAVANTKNPYARVIQSSSGMHANTRPTTQQSPSVHTYKAQQASVPKAHVMTQSRLLPSSQPTRSSTTALLAVKKAIPLQPPNLQHKQQSTATTKQPFALFTRPSSATKRPLQYKPGPVPLNPLYAHEWVYPVASNFPTRQYQLEMTRAAIFQNTLVSLPTGLGKTLIAAVVLYNYYRWFPTGKILFLAPTLPLVHQQVRACYDVMGIPPDVTAMITGKLPATKRGVVWNERSVFFCTPQTVQNDLVEGRCPARNVVCVVLDEAHKTTGDYAYARVVSLLEQAGACFRVVGLSATPGANIKAIQQVVDALRIHKVVARSDQDEDVKKYINTRHTEIILIPQTSAAKNVELALNGIIGPLLDRLRQANLLKCAGGNTTVTAYQIVMVMQDLKTLPNQDPSLFGYAAAANKFVQMRDHLARQGVGIVRQNLAALRNEPQRGILSSIVKGPECDRLWEEVLKASADPTNTTLQDKLARNPKLMKLAEILTEFFERARACNKSSRAIVFSQFRDSVSEILSTLEHSKPLIRPRHFIGQGKGAKGDAVGQLKGMKQAEQQAAMREFRSDVYNVLIATSIGEEGLDIGEVDLIVNFDTLSSPIRMIQRIGRTGRKRDGKVVCLVLEGAEENTMRKSHQSERTLAHALRKPDSFKNAPNFLMFPNPPELKQMDMAVFQNFRVSQVEGHDKAKQAKRRRSSGEKSRGSIRLSEEDEIRRLQTLGQFANLYLELTLHIVSTVRRRLLTARNMMLVNAIKAKNRYVGKKTALLHQIESAYPFPKAIRSRAVRGETAPVDLVFPIAPSAINQDAGVNLFQKDESKQKVDCSSSRVDANILACRTNNTLTTTAAKFGRDRFVETSDIVPAAKTNPGLNDTLASETKLCSYETVPNEVAAPSSGQGASHVTMKRTPSETIAPELACQPLHEPATKSTLAQPTALTNKSSVSHTATNVATAQIPANDFNDDFVLPCDSDSSCDENDETSQKVTCLDSDVFQLPSQPDSSSDEDDEVVGDAPTAANNETTRKSDGLGALTGLVQVSSAEGNLAKILKPNPYAKKLGDAPVQTMAHAHANAADEPILDGIAEEFQLPTQESSSDDDSGSSSDELPLMQRLMQRATKNKEASRNSMGYTVNSADACAHQSTHPSQQTSSMLFSNGKDLGTRRQSASSDIMATPLSGLANFECETQESSMPLRIKPNKRILVIKDSPSQNISNTGAVSPAGDLLVNTPAFLADTPPSECEQRTDPENIACAICLSRDWCNEDPLVLCDGSSKRNSCDLAVHMTCYSVNPNEIDFDSDAEWRCESCLYRKDTGRTDISCCACNGSDGTMRQLGTNGWMHINCDTAKAKPKQRLKKIQANRLDNPPKARLKKLAVKANLENDDCKRSAIEDAVFAKARQPLVNLSANDPSSADRQRRKRRRLDARKFIHEEAELDGDDSDDDLEDEELAAIEEEEALGNSSFINDSSQLGFTQDSLDRVEVNLHDDTDHRALDAERARLNEFATPALNRRHKRRKEEGKWTDTPTSAASSEKGLGNMHFIRSLMDHCRQGGRAEDIEQFYQQMEGEASQAEESNG